MHRARASGHESLLLNSLNMYDAASLLMSTPSSRRATAPTCSAQAQLYLHSSMTVTSALALSSDSE
jgi:hypothetical protein